MGEIESEGLPRVRCPLALQTLIEVKRPMSCGMYIYRERGDRRKARSSRTVAERVDDHTRMDGRRVRQVLGYPFFFLRD